jgi:hypothetical protein
MANPSQSEQARDYAFSELARVGSLEKLTAPLRTVVIIVSAQGVIDNGGLQYFFENDFPDHPDYSVFVDAYRAIGAGDAASALAGAVTLFPFREPQKHFQQRREFLDQFLDGGDHRPDSLFYAPTRTLWDARIWERLDEFVHQNAEAFPTQSRTV